MLEPEDTDEIVVKQRELPLVYDWELIEPSGKVHRIYYGDWVLSRNITT